MSAQKQSRRERLTNRLLAWKSVGFAALLASTSARAGEMTFDAAGNLVVADSYSVLKYALDGTKTVLATSLRPSGLTFDGKGNLFVSDGRTNAILKITPNGTKTTFANGFNAVGMACDSSGNLFVSQGDSIFKFAPNGAKKTFVSGLDNPSDLAFDGSGNLFVVEPAAYERNIVTGRDTLTFSPVILKISPDGTRSTFTTGLKGPGALAVDPAGDVYVTDGAANDNSSRAILKFRADGTKSTLTSALGLGTRLGIALDPSGNVFVDMQDSILKFTPDGNSTTFASAGRSSEETRDPSPDGQFAMLLTRTPEGVKIQLVEVSSHKVVAELADSGGPYDENCKLLWATDSQRVAFYQAEHRGGHTTVYFRSNLRFIQVELPSMPGCATPAQKNELRNKGLFKFIEYNSMPKAWLKSGALVVIDHQGWETNDSELRGCTQTVTIVFDAKHEASIQQVTGKKIKKY